MNVLSFIFTKQIFHFMLDHSYNLIMKFGRIIDLHSSIFVSVLLCEIQFDFLVYSTLISHSDEYTIYFNDKKVILPILQVYFFNF